MKIPRARVPPRALPRPGEKGTRRAPPGVTLRDGARRFSAQTFFSVGEPGIPNAPARSRG